MSERDISVGIIGHRPNRLPVGGIAAVTRDMALLVRAIAAARPGARPWAVSSLAEGADRIGAVEALSAGYRLSAVLPFERQEYERDFPASRADFVALLDVAERVTELPGSRSNPDGAYEAAAFAVLAAVEMLIVVWDGGPSQGRGGTTDTIAEAIARNLPVLWIDAAGQRRPVIHHAGLLTDPLRSAIEGAIS